MSAAEEQEEGVVAPLGGGGPRLGVRRLLAAVTGGLAAAGIDEPPGRDRRQPRARVARRVLGPHPQRLQQRLLQRVLGGIEVLAPPVWRTQPGLREITNVQAVPWRVAQPVL